MSRNAVQRGPDGEKMKIQHTTHDEALDELPKLRRRASMASIKVCSYISRRLSKALDMSQLTPNLEEERPPTMWPRFGEPKPKPAEEMPEMAAYLVRKHRIEKAAKIEQDTISSANSSGSYLALRPPKDKTPSSPKVRPLPLLKRKGKFSELVKEKLNRKSNESGSRGSGDRIEEVDKMVKIHSLRKAMLEGKLERVIPPSRNISIGTVRGRRAPPRPVHNPFLENSSPAGSIVSCRDQTQISSTRTRYSRQRNSGLSGSGNGIKARKKESKIVSLIGTSADVLDETRREIQGKFLPPFEHLSYPGFGQKKRHSADVDADSDESFFCLGDAQDLSSKPARLERKEKGRLSGEGRDPWVSGPVMKCKLCGLGRVSGIRGLCGECEADFVPPRPKAPMPESQYSDSEYEDDVVVAGDDEDDDHAKIKPTPSLKDWKPLSIKMQAEVSRNPFEFIDTDSDDERPSIQPKDDIIVGLSIRKNASKPFISGEGPRRQFSQRAEVEEEEDAKSVGEKFRRWETESMGSPGFENSRMVLRRWSSCFGDTVEEEDGVSLVEARDCEGAERNSEFYRFWDEVLRDHGTRMPVDA